MLCTVRPKCQVRAQSQTYLTINGHFRLGSKAEVQRLAHLRLLLGVKQTK
jgi:hypothetical protein